MSRKKQKQAHDTQHWRGHDVTGAIGLVRELMGEEAWTEMGKGGHQPPTDRDAARFFFEIDRGNHTLGDFLEFLKQHNEQELQRLREAERVPPKRLVGFVNMATGEKRAAFPDFITMPADAYDELLHLVRWIELMPACVELPDGAWDRVNDTIVDFIPLDEAQWPGVFVDSVQIETVDTIQRNITPGTLVVLLQHEGCDGDDTEHHCVLVRGAE